MLSAGVFDTATAHCDSAARSMAEPPIITAVRTCDVEALRREIAAGGDPDMLYSLSQTGLTPLWYAACYHTPYNEEQIRERLECISVLLEAGASVDKLVCGVTPLYHVVASSLFEDRADEIAALVEALVKAGADVNWEKGTSVLAGAAARCTAATVKCLISAGAVDLDRALVKAIDNGKQRNCAPLLRAGASLPPHITDTNPLPTRAYIEKIRAAGGYKAYEKAHRQRLVAIFLAKFPMLPVEMLERVLGFTWDIGAH